MALFVCECNTYETRWVTERQFQYYLKKKKKDFIEKEVKIHHDDGDYTIMVDEEFYEVLVREIGSDYVGSDEEYFVMQANMKPVCKYHYEKYLDMTSR